MSASKLILSLGALAIASTLGMAQTTDSAPVNTNGRKLIGTNPSNGSYSALLYDNGGFVTGTGNGSGGSDTSEIEVGFNTYGFNASASGQYRCADDFTVPSGKVWQLSDLRVFGYQTGAPNSGTVIGVTVRIWSGSPMGGGTILAGDTSTNRMTGKAFTNVYRVTNTTLLDVNRAVIEHTVDMSWAPTLPAGTYYVDVQLTGSGGFAGPWVNPTVPRLLTDNAEQQIPGGTWQPMQDNFMLVAQDLPFKLNGIEGGGTTIYCNAKTNALGCLPAIGSTGAASATAGSGFNVTSINNRNQKSGLLFYGTTGQANQPFQGGTLCVKSPIKRTPAFNSGGTPLPANDCSGVYSIDMNSFAVGGLGGSPSPLLQVPGTVVNCQFWGRDPGFPAPNNTSLSDGLEYTVGP